MIAWQLQGVTANSWIDYALEFASDLEGVARRGGPAWNHRPGRTHEYRYDPVNRVQTHVDNTTKRVMRRQVVDIEEYNRAAATQATVERHNNQVWERWEGQRGPTVAKARGHSRSDWTRQPA